MTVGVATCSPDTPVVEVARLLLDKQLEAVVVLDQEGHAPGVVSRDDLVRCYARHDGRDLTAADIMTDGVPELPPDIPLTAAAQLMRDQGMRAVFLMHHAGGIEYPAATLSFSHFLRHLVAQDDSELDDLGIAAARQAPLDAFIEKRDVARRKAEGSTQE
jgi:CBS domain-containing protein